MCVHFDQAQPHDSGQTCKEIAIVSPAKEERAPGQGAVVDVVPATGIVPARASSHTLWSRGGVTARAGAKRGAKDGRAEVVPEPRLASDSRKNEPGSVLLTRYF